LLQHFRSLSQESAETLLSFADFLSSREQQEPVNNLEIKQIERPQEETVINAIRRLSETFPMLEKDRLFHETSGLMNQHMLQGRAAKDVIDELEQLFRQHYDNLNNNMD